MNIRAILEEIVAASGGRIYPGYPDKYIWIEHPGGHNEVIMLLSEDDINLVKDFHSSTLNFPGERYIFCLKDVNPEIYSYCISKNIVCVKRNELITIIGRSVIDLGIHSEKLPRDVEVKDENSIYIRLETGRMPKYIKPILSASEIKEYIGTKSELFFVPFHFYTYSCDLKVEEKIIKRNGGVIINSLNGQASDSIKGFELVDKWPFAHKEMEIKWEPDVSIERAKDWIKKNNLGITTESKETRFFFIYFKKRTEPLEDTIKIKYDGTYFYPFYVSSGLVLDGLKGEIYNVQDIF